MHNMPTKTRTAPRYETLYKNGVLNATFLIGPDPLDADFDHSVFLGLRLRLRTAGFEMTDSKRGMEIFECTFRHDDTDIGARIRLVHGRNYYGDLQKLWSETVASEDLIYLKTHAGYGKHISISDDVSFFTDAMREGFEHKERKAYQLYYLDCCKSEMYYKDVFRDYIGKDGVDLILHKWFCDYKIVGPVIVLIQQLMAGSDFDTIVDKMNDEYGVPHFDVEDDPSDMTLDRKMVTYSVS